MTLTLNEQQVNVLKSLLVQLMANQVNTNQRLVFINNKNCIFFIEELEKSAQKEKPVEQEPTL